MKHVKKILSGNKILIASDSLSALLAINGPPYNRTTSPSILNIRNLLQYLLHSKHIRTSFFWILGHSSVTRNERADEVTQVAGTSPHATKTP